MNWFEKLFTSCDCFNLELPEIKKFHDLKEVKELNDQTLIKYFKCFKDDMCENVYHNFLIEVCERKCIYIGRKYK